MSVPTWVIDVVFAAFVLLMTYALSSEGLWGAALMFFNVLFAGLIAFNFYEPLAKLIDSTGIGWGFSDTLSLLSIFCLSVLILRMTTETLAPAMVRFPTPVYHAGRLIFALGTSLVSMAILILGFHTAPVHKKVFGSIDYQKWPPFGLGLDHQWLGFFQYTTGDVFVRYGAGGRDPYGRVRPQRQRAYPRAGLRSEGTMAPGPSGGPALRHRTDPPRRVRRQRRGGGGRRSRWRERRNRSAPMSLHPSGKVKPGSTGF